jgi:hypothetical protein
MRLCSVPNCGRKHSSGGYCEAHMRRLRLYGELGFEPIHVIGDSLEALKARFDQSWMPIAETGCWLWLGSYYREDGYGRCTVGKGKSQRATHVAWRLYRGESISKGSILLHRCDHRWCVNPDHLKLGTHKENMADMTTKKRQAVGERNGQSKLTEADVILIRNSPEGPRALGRRYGVARQTIQRIRRGIDWAYLLAGE